MNTIIFQYHDVAASSALEDFTKSKLSSVFENYDFVLRADVFFKTENTTSRETGMKCGIRLSAPGPRLFAESSRNTFQDAVTEAVRDITAQLRKRKETMKTY